MRFSSARGTKSRTVSTASRGRLTSCVLRACSLSSARAMASSWLTMCAARWVERAICCSERLTEATSPPLSSSRWANSACMRRPASGVFSWWAASAKKCFCALIDRSSRASRSLIERTSGATSSGASRSSMGDRSWLSRSRMRRCSALSGASPRASASHTSSTATGRMTNCGRITPRKISVARRERLSSVVATCTSGTLSLGALASASHM